jgi:hypothetical protein
MFKKRDRPTGTMHGKNSSRRTSLNEQSPDSVLM